MLQRELGTRNMAELDRERLIRFGRDRAKQGAGPVTVGMDFGRSNSSLSTPPPCMASMWRWSRFSWRASR